MPGNADPPQPEGIETHRARDDRLGDFTTRPRVLTLTAMAAGIGVVSAFVALVLLRLIGLITNLVYYHQLSSTLVSPAANRLGVAAVLIPMAGGLIVGLMARYGSERIRGHGIPEALEAILIGQSRMTVRVAILKPLSSAISIGTGGPFGAEGPIIMTGGAFGSVFGQLFRLSAAERKTLLVAGAAGGMAAVFATPLAAVLLAVELLLFEWKPRSFIPVATAAAVAAAIRVPLLGAGPIFPVAPHAVLPLTTLLLALGFGVVAGLGSALLTATVYGCEDLFLKLPIHWMWWPVFGGLAIGVGGLVYPRALGVGYDTIADLLGGRLVGGVLLGLLITKALIWAVSLGSGTSGGVLAPLLIMGGALGGLEAHWAKLADPGLWAMISMGAVMGGTMRSPFTAVAFVLEFTHDVNVLPPLFVACIAADLVTVLLMRRSILTEKVARRGHHVMREYAVSPLHRLRVESVMEQRVPTVPATLDLRSLFHRVANEDPVLARRHAWPIVDDGGRLVGLLTRGDLVRALESDDFEAATVLDAGTRSLVVTYPDELLEQATAKMIEHDVGRLPVVSRDDPRRLVGYLGRSGVLAAWSEAAKEEHEREPGWLTEGWRAVGATLSRMLAE
jgi:H+/Cl- antiporter ClcA/CBS domain-containing protein